MPETRVIFVNRVYWPAEAATARLLTDLAEALAGRGWPVQVIAAGDGPGARAGVQIHRTGGPERHRGIISQALNYRRFRQSARRALHGLVQPGDIVVLMTDPPMLATAGSGLVRTGGVRVIHWIHDIYPEIVTAHAGAWLHPFLWPLRHARNRAWCSADRCVALSAGLRETLRRHGVADQAAVIMPNWAPPELDTPPPAAAVAARRQAWALEGKFVAAYFGNLGRVHDFATLLAAADELRDEPDIVFLFAGEGPRFAEVRRAAAARPPGQLRFLPPQPRSELAAALAAADAHFVTLRPGFERLVSPSKLAGMLAAGRPALYVGPRAGGIADLLEGEGGGWSFGPAEAGALAAALRRLRDEPATRRTLGAAARASYARHFTFAAAVAGWEKLLRELSGVR